MSQTSEKLVVSQPLESGPNQSRLSWYERTIYTLFALAFLEQVALDTVTYNQREKAAINLQREHAEKLTVNPDEIFDGVRKGSMPAYFSNSDLYVYLMKYGFPQLFKGINCGVFINQIKSYDVDNNLQTLNGARVALNTTQHCVNLSDQVTIFNPDKKPIATGKIIKNITLNNEYDPSVLIIAEFDDASGIYPYVMTGIQSAGTELLKDDGTLQICHTPKSTGWKEMCEVVEIVDEVDGNYIINTTVTGGDSGASVIKVTENKKEVVCTISRTHSAYVSDNLAVCSRIDQDLDYYAISQLLLATYNDPLYWELNLHDN